MTEADCKRALVTDVNSRKGGWARRVEDRFAVGILDLIIKLPDLPVLFAEGKLIKGNLFFPTPRQWIEGERIIDSGLKAALIGWKGRAMYVSPWVKVADCRECVYSEDHIKVLTEFMRLTG